MTWHIIPDHGLLTRPIIILVTYVRSHENQELTGFANKILSELYRPPALKEKIICQGLS